MNIEETVAGQTTPELLRKLEYENARYLVIEALNTEVEYKIMAPLLCTYMQTYSVYHKTPSALETMMMKDKISMCDACSKMNRSSGQGWGFNK